MPRTGSAVLSMLLAMAAPALAFAHAKMASSVPQDGASVPAGLAEVQLDFTKPMRLTVVHVTQAKDHKEIPAKSPLPTSFEKSVKIALDPLPAGPYEVSWTAVADDGHVMNGGFKFSVTEAKAAQPTQ